MYPNQPETGGFQKVTASTNYLSFNYTKIYVTATCTLDVVDMFGNTEAAVPFTIGVWPFRFAKITAISAGSVYLCHNQDKVTDIQDINKPQFPQQIAL